MKSHRSLSFPVLVCRVLSNSSLKMLRIFFLCFYLSVQGQSFLTDTTSPKCLTSISPLPHLHVCCSFSFLENPARSLKQNQSLTLSFPEAPSTRKLCKPGTLLLLIIFLLTVPCFRASGIALGTSLAWVWIYRTINNDFGYM